MGAIVMHGSGLILRMSSVPSSPFRLPIFFDSVVPVSAACPGQESAPVREQSPVTAHHALSQTLQARQLSMCDLLWCLLQTVVAIVLSVTAILFFGEASSRGCVFAV